MRIRVALFRRHILNRTEELTHFGEHCGEGNIRIGGAGHTEVDNLNLPGGIDQNIGGF